jgi:hypothetical protein
MIGASRKAVAVMLRWHPCGIVIRGDLENLGGIGQPVDFIQHEATSAESAQKGFRIGQFAPHAGQFAIEVLDGGEGLAEDRLADAPDTGEPDDGSCLPQGFESAEPGVPFDHGIRMSDGAVKCNPNGTDHAPAKHPTRARAPNRGNRSGSHLNGS